MAALTADRNTPRQQGVHVSALMAATAVIHAGALVAINATGYAVPGSTATGLTYFGRAEEAKDNSGGADGDETVLVRRQDAFQWENSGTDPVGQASLGKVCYIEDDQTVAATDGTGTRSEAGIVIGIDADGVWVQ